MPFKIDMHVHTVYSKDGFITLNEAVKKARNTGLDGIAITDHDNIEALKRIPKNSEIIIIPGIEVSSSQGHIIGLGITQIIEGGLSPGETIEKIRKAGGAVIFPHLGDHLRHGVKKDILIKNRPDAIETINSSYIFFDKLVKNNKKIAEEMKLPQTAGSDAHVPETIGCAYTLVQTESSNLDDILSAIKNGKVSPYGVKDCLRNRLKKIVLEIKSKIGGYKSSI
jgi:predicted metal-dependent phosphoesterase TrpH